MTTTDNCTDGKQNILEVFKKWIENNKQCLSELESEITNYETQTTPTEDSSTPTVIDPSLKTLVAGGLNKMTKCFNILAGNDEKSLASTNESDSEPLVSLFSKVNELEKEMKKGQNLQTSLEEKITAIANKQKDLPKDFEETSKKRVDEILAKCDEKIKKAITEKKTMKPSNEIPDTNDFKQQQIAIKSEIEELFKKHDVHNKKLDSEISDMNAIKQEQESLKSQIAELLKKKDAQNEKLHSEISDINAIKQEQETLKSQIAELLKKNDTHNEKLNNILTQSGVTDTATINRSDVVNPTTKPTDEKSVQEKNLDQDVKNVETRVKSLEEKHNNLIKDMGELKLSKEVTKKLLANFDTNLNTLNANFEVLDKRVYDMESSLQQLNTSFTDSYNELYALNSQVDDTLKNQKTEINQLNLDIQSIKQDSRQTDAKIVELYKKNVEAAGQKKSQSTKSDNADLAPKLNSYLAQLGDEIKTETQNRNGEISSLKSEIQSMKQDHQKVVIYIASLSKHLTAQVAQLAKASDLNNVTQDLNQCKKDTANLQGAVDELITRVKVGEKAMCGYQDDADDVRKMQTDNQRQITALSDKQTDFQKSIDKFTLFTTSTEKKFVATVEKMDKIEDKLKTAMTDVGKNLGAITTKQNEVKKTQENNVADLKSNVQKLFKFFNENVAVQLKDLNINLDSITKETLQQNTRLDSLETYTDEISGACQGLELDLTQTKSQLDLISQQNEKIEYKISELVQKNDDLKKSTISDLQTFSSKLDSEMRELTKRLDEDLMRLQTDIGDTLSQVRDLESEIKDTQSGKTAIGFTASPNNLSSINVKEGEVVKHFREIAFNEGHYYDTSTGAFTAPVSGLYYTSLTVSKMNQGRISLHVKHRPANAGRGDRKVKVVCRAHSGIDDNSSTGSGLVYLEKGDVLYVVSVNVSHDAALNCYSSFSCFLVKG